MTLHADLLGAVTAPSGGKISLILGAGCSFEAPTNLPLAKECSEEAHGRLLADGVIGPGECADPSDLSCLADAVYAKTGSQRALVERLLNAHSFKTPPPNEGYRIAAALLLEAKVCAVVTLNFDLAMSVALAELGAGPEISVIDGPHELVRQSMRNVYYLHRNANASDPDEWVLRTTVLQGEWKGKWEQHITTKALTVPIVVFVGLGSPAAVLLESATLIRQSTPGTATSFQVDPGDPGDSAFFAALKLDIGSFFKLGWCEFMESLADHLASFQSVELEGVIARHADDNALEPEDCTALVAWLREIGLIKFGLLRAKLLMGDPPYEPDTAANRPLVADLLHAIAMVQRRSGAIARLCEDGVVEFVRDGRITSAFILASGRGSRGKVAMQSKVRQTMRKLRGRHCFPQGAIIAASDWSEPISVPEDIVNEQLSASILTAQSAPTLIHVSELRANVEMINKVSP